MEGNIKILSGHKTLFKAVRLEFLFPRKWRFKALRLSWVLFFLFLVLFFVPFFENDIAPLLGFEPTLLYYQLNFFGLLGVVSVILWFLLLAEFYFLSVSRPADFLEVAENTPEGEVKKIYKLDFGGARRMFHLEAGKKETVDLGRLYGFLSGGESNFTALLLLRLNVNPEEFTLFTDQSAGRKIEISRHEFLAKLTKNAATGGATPVVGAKEFMLVLFEKDKDFEKFLFDRKIRRQELAGASLWVASMLEESREKSRWWERKSLGKTPGIAKDLGFGYTYTLDQYSHEIIPKTSRELHFLAHQSEINSLEEALSRSGQTNAFLVGEPGAGKHTIIEALAGKILEGSAMPALEHKRMIMLDTTALTATAKDKGPLEELLVRAMNEAASAGNIILVIDNFPEFLNSAAALGVEIVSLLEPYLEGFELQVIALAGTDEFHRIVEPNGKLMSLFGKIEVKETPVDETVKILEDLAPILEYRLGAWATYQGVRSVAELAERYISQGVMPEKAVDLFDRAMAYAAAKENPVLLPEDAERVVEREMGIPIVKATGKEAEKLLHLEDILHERVVDQEEAIKAVSDTLRRARTGLHTGKRPIGSFLFLGPTGVGKTETAKALSRVYFGSENAMSRFDMSEFQGMDAIEKLIGFASSREQGVLSTALREKPFSLLLFDEFEKSSREVINLFLQILDEGMFTDSFGKKVSAKDAIIIATSNAGSNLIWDLVKAGKDPASIQKEVVDHIRQEGIFAPEILNRFDAIVVFHPLDREKLKAVAKILLNELASRLKEKDDVILEITEELAEKIADIGYDPVMGARPMRRAIQDRLEQLIAQKMLKGELPRGSNLKLYPEDLNKL